MVLKEQELLQIDETFIRHLLDKDPKALANLSVQLANDLKEALERLNQNPTNSSRPSGSLAPWDTGHSEPDEKESEEAENKEDESADKERDVIKLRRQGKDVPQLPPIPVSNLMA